jgi:hypothetical protein
MQLYQRSRELARHFPAKILCSHSKSGTYTEEGCIWALSNASFIQYNSKDRISVIAVDIDAHRDASIWFEHDLPCPTWTIWTDRGVQLAWVLHKPILARVFDHMRHAKDVLHKIVYALDADTAAIGLNRVFRNPVVHESRFSDSRVNLSDFGHLATPPREWFDTIYATNRQKDLFGDTAYGTGEIGDLATMKDGDGRNCAVFDLLRFWAYNAARKGKYSEFDLAHKGYTLNNQLGESMDQKEIDRIIGSIDNFMTTKWGGGYMANTTPEERKANARENQKKGAAARRNQAYGRIGLVVDQFHEAGKKVTANAIAKEAKADKRTVLAWLEKHGYRNEGGSTGWVK